MAQATLVIRRSKHVGRDMFRAYQFTVGRTGAPRQTLSLRNGREQTIELPPGSYLVQAKIAWCLSRIGLLELADGDVVTVTLSPNLDYSGVPVKGSDFANDYIRLTVEPGAAYFSV
ncbi:hypothetical protein KDL01_35500 [Actinospica durhamensis]|uniref:Uncharacterized protein n=1 Tax=Actinospica durhamensis TaxID=1508375 RepID=A0A941EWL0_9ACTN|nr:hypothetical protein [Actinospica durhamensis]MBR7838628.1 hypothetical protein [Actinospica durhamensis]